MEFLISDSDKTLLKLYQINCKVEKGIGTITYGTRSFQVSLLSSNETDLSSYLEQGQLKKVVQKVAVILLRNNILQESSHPSAPPLRAEITKEKITNLNDPRKLFVPIKEQQDYQRIEAYLFSRLNRDKPTEKTNDNTFTILPLYRPVKVKAPRPVRLSQKPRRFWEEFVWLIRVLPIDDTLTISPEIKEEISKRFRQKRLTVVKNFPNS